MNIEACLFAACALLMVSHPMVASFDTRRDLRQSLLSEPASGARRAVAWDLRPGARVSGSIELVRPLAAGGMGQVWLAEHRGLDIQVAVKFMRREVADDPVSVSRFEQEAKLAARIKSPHVVEVFDYDVTDSGLPFIVMESLRGRDLETVVENGRTLGIGDTARVLVQVCKALTKAHAMGVIHRDIKAENVFVVQDEGVPTIKVLDFGVAKETSSEHTITLSGTTVGTPAYMSPEQLFHPRDIDLRTDLWAIAVLVYRCLTGNFPFEGESFPSVCLSVSKGKFAPPSAYNSGLPGGLDAWFKKAFHKNLEARFSSAAEMSEAFLNELRKADLLPAWAEPGATEVAPSSATQLSAGVPFSSSPAALRRRAWLRMGAVGVGMALATLFFFEIAPPPVRAAVRATVADMATQATERAQDWAVNEGFLPASASDIDTPWATATNSAKEIAWLPLPSPLALAEREAAFVVDSRRGVAVRSDQIVPRASTPLPVSRPLLVSREVEPWAASAPAAPPSSIADSAPPSAPMAPPPEAPADLATIRFGL